MAQTRTRKNTQAPTNTERPASAGQGTSTVATTPARRVNFANIGTLVDPGEYTAVLEGHKWGESRKGDEMLTLIFKIKDHEEFANKKIYRNYMTEGDGAYYMMDALVQCGADPDELMAEETDSETGEVVPPDLEPIIKTLYGANVKFTLGHRQYKDQNGNDKTGYEIDNLKSI
jgi:hypothetical protein